MTVREIINSIEAEKLQLKEENKILKDENKKLSEEIDFLKKELSKKETNVVTSAKPIVEEVESQVTSIVVNVDGEVNASIVDGGKISIDDVLPEKQKKNRKKKVEPVEELIENE